MASRTKMSLIQGAFLSFTILLLIPLSINADTIFGFEPSGEYWGANVDTDGKAANVKFPLYNPYKRVPGGVSYDPVSGQALFELHDPHELAFGPLCTNSHGQQPEPLMTISEVPLEEPNLGIMYSGRASGFTLHDSNIYFLHYGSYGKDEEDFLSHRFQVRVMQTCDECNQDPYDETDDSLSMLFSVRCSRVVAEVVKQSDVLVEYSSGNVLKVTAEPGSDRLTFYFQIGRFTQDEDGTGNTEMILYRMSSDGDAEELHTERLSHYISTWDEMKLIGAVDYRDGLLCWTTTNSLLCRLPDGSTIILVAPAEAISDVCTGTSDAREHLADISGVAILKNEDTGRVIVFGCSAQSPNITGVGLVKMPANGPKIMEPLKAGGELLTAGMLLSAQAPPEACTFDPRPKVCVRLPKTTIPPSTTTATTTTTTVTTTTTTTTSEQEIKPEPESEGENGDIDPEANGEGGAKGEDDNGVIPGDVTDNEQNKAVSGNDNGAPAASTHSILHLLCILALCVLLS